MADYKQQFRPFLPGPLDGSPSYPDSEIDFLNIYAITLKWRIQLHNNQPYSLLSIE